MKKHNKLSFISHILILALVLVIAVGATFSWYSRTGSSAGVGRLFEYTQSGNVNGKGGTLATYVGTNNNGVITYSTEELTKTGASVTTEPGSLNYFKTVITDEGSEGDSMVSVYLEDFTFSSGMGNSIRIGLTQPEKTYKQFSSTSTTIDSVCLEDNIFIKEGGTVEIYWFIEIDSSYTGNGTINLGTIHLVYS